MKFQKTRNPESLAIEARAAEHAAAGYPVFEHDSAMDAESIIKAARLANDDEQLANRVGGGGGEVSED